MHRYTCTLRRFARLVTGTTLLGVLLLGLALAPTPTRAAPALTLTPAAVPRGGTVTVAGAGFAPGAQLALFIVLPQFGGARVQMADLTVGAGGDFTATVRMNDLAPGPTPLVVAGGGADLAQAVLTVTDAPSVSPERLTVAPGSGPAGTRFTASGTGLTPGLALTALTTESALGPQGHFRQVAQITVPADGRVTFPIDTTGYDPAGYDLIVFGPGGPAIGLPLVVAQFTVAAVADPAAVLERFLDARNRGDVNGALALVTDDIQFVGGPSCTAAQPCLGKDAQRNDIEGFVALHGKTTIVGTPQVAGMTVRARLEVRADLTRAAGIDRFIDDLTVEIRDGKIASLRAVSDMSDSQTAQFYAYLRAQQPPAPGTMPGLPNTGGGGMAAPPLGDQTGLLGLGALLGALLLATATRRRHRGHGR